MGQDQWKPGRSGSPSNEQEGRADWQHYNPGEEHARYAQQGAMRSCVQTAFHASMSAFSPAPAFGIRLLSLPDTTLPSSPPSLALPPPSGPRDAPRAQGHVLPGHHWRQEEPQRPDVLPDGRRHQGGWKACRMRHATVCRELPCALVQAGSQEVGVGCPPVHGRSFWP